MKIGRNAFYNCTKLETAVVPPAVFEIGTNAFSGCNKLTITTSSGSVAEEYAIENNIPVKNP